MAKQPAPSSKSHPFRALAIILVIAGLVGVGIFAYRLARGIQMPAAPLANAPRGATIVGFVRVQNVLHSGIVRRIVRRELLEDRLEHVRERCGFDPTTQLDDLILFVEGGQIRDLESIGIVARGPFEHERLARCFREAFAEEGLGEMRRVEIDDVPAAAPANSEQRAAFLGQRGVAIGREETVRHVIRTVRDDQPSARQDPVLARLWDLTASGRDIVLVGKMPQDWQQALREAVGVGSDARFRGTLDQVTALGLGADVTRGLRLGAVVELRDVAASTQLATTLRAQIDQLTNNMLISLTPFGPVLRSIHTEQRGQDFIITMDLPPERLDRMIEFAEAYQQGSRSDRAAGAPDPVPTITIPPSGGAAQP